MLITESERLVLRELETLDGDALASIWGNGRVMQHCGGALSADTISRVIQTNRQNCRTHGYAVFAAIQKADGALIGVVGCKPDAADPRRGEMIYHFGEPDWGKGFASEAVAAYLNWASAARNLDCVYASAVPDNIASIRVLQKNGFVQNGFVRFEDTGFVSEPFYERHFPAVPKSEG